jgi:hypothetical protein
MRTSILPIAPTSMPPAWRDRGSDRATHCHRYNQLALAASSSTARGQDTVGRVVSTINSIADASRQIAEVVAT